MDPRATAESDTKQFFPAVPHNSTKRPAEDTLPSKMQKTVATEGLRKTEGLQTLEKYREGSYPRAQTFWSKKTVLKELSNFAPIPVEVRGLTYPTGEHAYHGQKFLTLANRAAGIDNERAQALSRYAAGFQSGGDIPSDPRKAKTAGGKKAMPLEAAEINEWYVNKSIAVQFEICRNKTKEDAVRTVLIDTGKDYLLHQDNRAKGDTLWGGKFPPKWDLDAPAQLDRLTGHNRLGLIWMAVRDELDRAD